MASRSRTAVVGLISIGVFLVPLGLVDAQWSCRDVTFCFGEACAACQVDPIGYSCGYGPGDGACCCEIWMIGGGTTWGARLVCMESGECECVW